MVYILAEGFRIYNSISVSFLTISLAIASLLIPYLKIWIEQVFNNKIKLEKEKRKLTAKQIADKYNKFEEEIGNMNNLFYLLFVNISISVIIIFLTTLSINISTYNCVPNIPNCQSQTPPLWSIDENSIVIGVIDLKISQIVQIITI